MVRRCPATRHGAAVSSTPITELLDRAARPRSRRRVPRRVRHDVHRRRRRRDRPTGSPTALARSSACSPAIAWPRWSRTPPRRCSPGGARSCAAARSPSRSTPRTRAQYLRHQLADSGARVLIVAARPRRPGRRRSPTTCPTSSTSSSSASPTPRSRRRRRATTWDDAARGRRRAPGRRRRAVGPRAPSSTPAARPARPRAACSATTTTRALAGQIGICWERTADDVVWTPLPLFHFNALVTAVLGRWSSAAAARSTGGSRCRTSGRR